MSYIDDLINRYCMDMVRFAGIEVPWGFTTWLELAEDRPPKLATEEWLKNYYKEETGWVHPKWRQYYKIPPNMLAEREILELTALMTFFAIYLDLKNKGFDELAEAVKHLDIDWVHEFDYETDSLGSIEEKVLEKLKGEFPEEVMLFLKYSEELKEKVEEETPEWLKEALMEMESIEHTVREATTTGPPTITDLLTSTSERTGLPMLFPPGAEAYHGYVKADIYLGDIDKAIEVVTGVRDVFNPNKYSEKYFQEFRKAVRIATDWVRENILRKFKATVGEGYPIRADILADTIKDYIRKIDRLVRELVELKALIRENLELARKRQKKPDILRRIEGIVHNIEGMIDRVIEGAPGEIGLRGLTERLINLWNEIASAQVDAIWGKNTITEALENIANMWEDIKAKIYDAIEKGELKPDDALEELLGKLSEKAWELHQYLGTYGDMSVEMNLGTLMSLLEILSSFRNALHKLEEYGGATDFADQIENTIRNMRMYIASLEERIKALTDRLNYYDKELIPKYKEEIKRLKKEKRELEKKLKEFERLVPPPTKPEERREEIEKLVVPLIKAIDEIREELRKTRAEVPPEMFESIKNLGEAIREIMSTMETLSRRQEELSRSLRELSTTVEAMTQGLVAPPEKPSIEDYLELVEQCAVFLGPKWAEKLMNMLLHEIPMEERETFRLRATDIIGMVRTDLESWVKEMKENGYVDFARAVLKMNFDSYFMIHKDDVQYFYERGGERAKKLTDEVYYFVLFCPPKSVIEVERRVYEGGSVKWRVILYLPDGTATERDVHPLSFVYKMTRENLWQWIYSPYMQRAIVIRAEFMKRLKHPLYLKVRDLIEGFLQSLE